MARVFVLIAMLLGQYVLTQTLVPSAAIRLLTGGHTNRWKMGAALVLALPQAAIVQLELVPQVTATIGWTPASLAVLGVSVALTLAGAVFWWLGRRGLENGRYWLEFALVVVVIGLQLYSVDNWIAG